MDKLILKVHKPTPYKCNVVRLNDDAARLVGELYAKTGISVNQIVSLMVEFAADKIEIVEATS